MADRWLDDFIEKELNKPIVLTRLLDQGFVLYGNQGSNEKHNEVYRLRDDIVLYNPFHDEILCSWNKYDLEDEDKK